MCIFFYVMWENIQKLQMNFYLCTFYTGNVIFTGTKKDKMFCLCSDEEKNSQQEGEVEAEVAGRVLHEAGSVTPGDDQ